MNKLLVVLDLLKELDDTDLTTVFYALSSRVSRSQIISALAVNIDNEIHKIQDDLDKKDKALLAALALVKESRVSKEMTQHLNKLIVESIDKQNACGYEQQFVDSIECENETNH